MLQRFLKDKVVLLENTLFYSLVLLSFFLGRRAGDSKDRMMVLIMGLSIFQYIYLEKKYILKNKYIYFLGIGYLAFLIFNISSIDYYDKVKDSFIQFTVFGILLFLVISLMDIKKEWYEKIFQLLLLFSLPRLFKGFEEFAKYGYDLHYRVTGGTIATVYSMEIGIYLVICFSLLLFSKSKLEKMLYYIYLLLGSSIIILAQSRALLLFLPITFIILFFLVKKITIKNLVIVLGICIGVLLVGLNISKPFENRVEKTVNLEKLKSDTRVPIYSRIPIIVKESFPKGLGFYYYKKEPLNTGVELVPHVHNTLGEILVTQGVISFIIYIIFQLLIGIKMLTTYFKINQNKEKSILIVGIAIYLFSAFSGLVDVLFYQGKIANMEYLILGLVFSYIFNKVENN